MSNSTAASTDRAPRRGQLLGLLLVSCATLMLQIAWTRVLSVSLWYHFAFLVISTAMLGFGMSGVLLAVSRRLAALPLDRALVLFASAQALATVAGFALANKLPFAPFSLLADRRQLLYAPLYVLCIAAPFVCAGLTVAMLLARRSAHAGRIYCYDLVGAGIGCVLVLLALPALGGSGAVLASAAIATAGGLCFASASGAPLLRRLLVPGVLLIALGAAALHADRLLPLRISHTKRLGGVAMHELLRSKQNLLTAWDASARIDVVPAPWGRNVLIDAGTAITRMPRVVVPPHQQPALDDERQIVMQPGARPSVLVIGSGGGWEVLAALRAGARRIVAVEVNPLINDLVTGPMAAFVGGIFDDARVELHTAEARSFIRRTAERYDVILASHTISNAATAAGALSLAEEYVLTREAFADYLQHLTPDGWLWLSRPVAQLPRLVATARQALADQGSTRPAAHVIVFAGDAFYGGLVLRRSPIPPAMAQTARQLLRRSGLRPLHLPGARAQNGIYRTLLEAPARQLAALYRDHPTQIDPATDDRPFFNQRTRWRDITPGVAARVFDQPLRARMALEELPVAEVVLIVVLLQSLLLAAALVLLPLAWRHRAALQGSFGMLAYFLLLGLGFILAEVALIQRLTLFVGQPAHAFAVVVGALLVSSGIGSLLSNRLVPRPALLPRRLRAILLACAAALIAINVVSPPLMQLALGLPLAARAAVAVVALAPVGAVLGMAFPVALRAVGQHTPALIPWAWGLNAVASVVGSVLAIILATMIGFSGVLTVAAATYLVALLLWWKR